MRATVFTPEPVEPSYGIELTKREAKLLRLVAFYYFTVPQALSSSYSVETCLELGRMLNSLSYALSNVGIEQPVIGE